MYRYQGNTGQYVWVPDTLSQPGRGGQGMRPAPSSQRPPNGRHPPEGPHPGPTFPASGGEKMPPPFNLGSGLGNILSNVFPDGFEMEDALLLLILFLMYRESGDKELLIIMGAMFLS